MSSNRNDSPLPTTGPIALNDLILRSIVDHAIVAMDADGIITRWNEGAERILGWTEEEAIGRHGNLFFTASDVENDRPETEMYEALKNGRAVDERWHVRKGGQRFWGSGLMMPLLAATDGGGDAVQSEGVVEGFVKIFRDGTLDTHGEGDLNRLESRAALAMRRSGTVGVYDYDLLEDIVVADPLNAALHSVPVAEAAAGTLADRFLDGIYAQDREEVRAAVSRAVAEGTDLDIVYRTAAAGSRPRWIQSQGSIHRDGDGRVARLSGIVTEVTEQHERTRMQVARLRFSDEVRVMSDATEVSRLASRVIGETLYANRAGHGYLGADGDVIHIDADWTAGGTGSLEGTLRYSDFGSFGATLREGTDVVIGDVRTDDRVPDSAALEAIGIRSLVNLPLMERGRLKAVLFVNDDRPRDWTADEVGFLQAIFDRADAALARVRSEAERDVMVAELAHRMKNMLTIAQVIVTQSLTRMEGMEEVRASIASRLDSLSKAQDILTAVNQQDADIADVVRTALKPHDPHGRIDIEGPSVLLEAQKVLGLSLALHELATNAAKYGALSGEAGRVELRWSRAPDGAFALRWSEHDGPPVMPPPERGFGSKILDRVAGSYFGGSSRVDFAPGGVRFAIDGRVSG